VSAEPGRPRLLPLARTRIRDGLVVHQGRCPGCGKWQDVDPDQLEGRISSECELCGFHSLVRWSDYLVEV
jgi:hypothetical protein